MKTSWKSLLFLCALATLALCSRPVAAAKIKVVATTSDLADLAKVVGGDRVDVASIGRGTQDVHLIDPRPSHVAMLRNANLFVKVGMDLDKWSDALVNAARNKNIRYGGAGYVDCSVKIHRLEVPTERIDPSKGEWHAYGNPHYWLDPANAEIITANILEGLERVSPRDAAYFEKNRDDFVAKLHQAMQRWEGQLAPYKGRKIVTYHRAWSYFVRRFGIDALGCLEPKPGIPPTASHVASLIGSIEAEKQPVVIAIAPFYPDKAAKTIASRTGARLVVVPTSVGGVKGADSYLELFDRIVGTLAKAFSR